METIKIKIDKQNYKIFCVEVKGKKLNIAQQSLENKIQNILENDTFDYFNDKIAEINGQKSTLDEVSSLYDYVYGNNENNPKEEDIIHSIEDLL